MKEWITDHDILQKTLAKEFHVTEAMMSHYMTGRNEITVDILVQFAKRTGLSMDYLVGLTDLPYPPMELSEGERDMVRRFRTLSREQRELIVKNIAIMQEQNKA
ncbi:helix-turn-helix domain-containing protein [Lawsonibacter sp. LCP25S3_G6]|uniref:helix-turn-helix domain-containing protein n=1 Tax=unclassified Lawsonibacter TaxID=2617946 RepID=UPI003F9D4AD8